MSLLVDMHHIFARGSLDPYDERIAALFQPGEFNPFDLNNNINKIGLVQNPALAAALQQLAASGNSVLLDAGLGGAFHPTDAGPNPHPGLNEFQLGQFKKIFDPSTGLSTEQKKLALFDLHRFSTQASVTGRPPITSTAEDWRSAFDASSTPLDTIRTADPSSSRAELFPVGSRAGRTSRSGAACRPLVGAVRRFSACRASAALRAAPGSTSAWAGQTKTAPGVPAR